MNKPLDRYLESDLPQIYFLYACLQSARRKAGMIRVVDALAICLLDNGANVHSEKFEHTTFISDFLR